MVNPINSNNVSNDTNLFASATQTNNGVVPPNPNSTPFVSAINQVLAQAANSNTENKDQAPGAKVPMAHGHGHHHHHKENGVDQALSGIANLGAITPPTSTNGTDNTSSTLDTLA